MYKYPLSSLFFRRNFRAKMVLSEKDEPDRVNPTAEGEFCDPDDIDGIGGIFFENCSLEEAREYFNIVSEHWAYESGNVIEQGAVGPENFDVCQLFYVTYV